MSNSAPVLPPLATPVAPTLPTMPAAPELPMATTTDGTIVLGSVMDVTAGQPLIITGLADCNSLTTFNIEPNATLGLQASVTTGLLTSITFGGGGTLVLSADFSLDRGSQIQGFGAGDSIDYTAGADHLSTCFTAAVQVNGQQISPAITTVNLENAAGQQLASLRLVGDYRSGLCLRPDGQGGSSITCDCLLAGTRILTPTGEVAVEDLRPGSVVLTADGAREVKWVGDRQLDTEQHPTPDAIRPIRIAAGAFGSRLPTRDLVVSPDHAIYVEGVLIPAKHLVNGSTVARDLSITRPHYVHVELEQHGILYAEGLGVESYLDTGGRDAFFEYGEEGLPAQHPDMIRAAWDALGCAPLVVCGPVLEAVRRRVDARAPPHIALLRAA